MRWYGIFKQQVRSSTKFTSESRGFREDHLSDMAGRAAFAQLHSSLSPLLSPRASAFSLLLVGPRVSIDLIEIVILLLLDKAKLEDDF